MARGTERGGKALSCLCAKSSCTFVDSCSYYKKCKGMSFCEMGYF